jgi:hypothetical protein
VSRGRERDVNEMVMTIAGCRACARARAKNSTKHRSQGVRVPEVTPRGFISAVWRDLGSGFHTLDNARHPVLRED